MTRRIEWLIVGVVVLALAGSLVLHALTWRQTSQAQLEQRSREAAGVLAGAMSRQLDDPAALRALADAHFDAGAYGLLRLQAGDGQVLVERRRPPAASQAPAWFTALLPIASPPVSVIVGETSREPARLELESLTGGAGDALWEATTRMAMLLAVLAVVAAGGPPAPGHAAGGGGRRGRRRRGRAAASLARPAAQCGGAGAGPGPGALRRDG